MGVRVAVIAVQAAHILVGGPAFLVEAFQPHVVAVVQGEGPWHLRATLFILGCIWLLKLIIGFEILVAAYLFQVQDAVALELVFEFKCILFAHFYFVAK